MNDWKDFFELLPESFKKPNNEKLFEVLFSSLVKLEQVFIDIQDTRNLDTAHGIYLDRLGAMYGEQRNGLDDELYREMIRTTLLSYLSNGEIKTIAELAKSIFKADYQSTEEAWHNSAYDNRPATVVINVNKRTDMTLIDTVKRVVAGGVDIQVASLNTWGNIFEESELWGNEYDISQNWGETYGYLEE